MTDIVERLKNNVWYGGDRPEKFHHPLHEEAAAEILRLRAALASARNEAMEDAGAKRLAWEYEKTKNVGWQGYSVDVLWQALSTEAKDGWRAVAKKVKP